MPSPEREILDFGFDAFNRGDFEAAVRYFHPGIVWRDPAEVPDASEHHGPDQVRALWDSFSEQWTGMRMDPVEFQEDGERTLVRVHFSGAGRESGAPMELEFFQVWTIRDLQARQVDSFMSRDLAERALHG
ncbi:MAG TPA: nuclear transport factor 2 family protein, partial [Thermoleophilaceae bacterium]